MKLVKIISAAAVFLGLASCNFDFKNSCDDKWVVTNSSTQEISITFNDTKTSETIGAASVSEGKITQERYDSYMRIADEIRTGSWSD